MRSDRLVFLGKKSVRKEEAEVLNVLGMGIGLAGYTLFTLTPGFSEANDAVAMGYNTGNGSPAFDLRKQKGLTEDEINSYEWVIYPDDALWQSVEKRFPTFWAAQNWTALPTFTSLQIFTEAMLGHVGDLAIDNGSVGT